MNINETRNHLIAHRSGMDTTTCAELSTEITTQLLQQPIFEQAQRIAVYLAHRNEVSTEKIIQDIWAQGKQCYLPVLAPDMPNSLHFLPYTAETVLQPNTYKILEPIWDASACLPAQDFDLVITPLVGFDKHCHRIGMGAGYYDRSFAFMNTSPRPQHPKLVGLGYELQKLDNIEPQPWDITLDAVFTENTVYQCNFE